MKNLKNNTSIKLFIFINLLSYLIIIISLIVTQGRLFSSLFFIDASDSGMDFFHSLVEVTLRQPYERFGVIYPPFANMVFLVLSFMVSSSIKNEWPTNHEETIYMVGTKNDLRLHQSSFILYVLFIVLMVLLLVWIVSSYLKNNIIPYSFFLTTCILFSSGILLAIERGNVILASVVLVLYFLIHYDSDNRFEREFAYVTIALAFGFKIYPIFFSLILLKDKRFIDFVKTMIYTVITLLPIHLFGGFKSYKIWILNIIEFNKNKIPAYGVIFRISILFICLVFLFFNNRIILKKHYRFTEKKSYIVFLLTIILYIFINDNSGYNLIYMVIPFLFFIAEEQNINKKNIFELLMYVFVLVPYGVNQLSSLFILIGIIGGFIRCIEAEKTKDNLS